MAVWVIDVLSAIPLFFFVAFSPLFFLSGLVEVFKSNFWTLSYREFRPVPAPESHTRIRRPEQQSYFLKYAEQLDLPVPTILVRGNRDIERLEAIVQTGKVDFIALSRPLIRQPDLPNRWRTGIGKRLTECASCNSCLYAMYVHPGIPEPGLVECICLRDKKQHKQAQKWLVTWRGEMVKG